VTRHDLSDTNQRAAYAAQRGSVTWAMWAAALTEAARTRWLMSLAELLEIGSSRNRGDCGIKKGTKRRHKREAWAIVGV
jgi:hypothetical protein